MASSCINDVRTEILAQHVEIRVTITGLASLARKSTWPTAVQTLQVALGRFAALFDAHLAFEERELAPLIHCLDVQGPERVAALLVEHVGQRTQIEDVYASVEAATWGASTEFTRDVLELVEDLLADIEEEEEMLDALVAIERRARRAG